jgi:hypothetical protein
LNGEWNETEESLKTRHIMALMTFPEILATLLARCGQPIAGIRGLKNVDPKESTVSDQEPGFQSLSDQKDSSLHFLFCCGQVTSLIAQSVTFLST